MNIDQAIRRLRQFKESIETPAAFWAAHRERYLEVAKTIVAASLRGGRPPEADPEAWQQGIEDVLALMSSDLFGDGTGMRLLYTPALAGGGDDLGAKLAEENFAPYDDILRWVEAGQRGDPGGKRLSAEEQGMDAEEIAARITEVLQWSQQPELLGHLAEFIAGETGAAFSQEELEAAFTDARNQIEPILRHDFEDYARARWND